MAALVRQPRSNLGRPLELFGTALQAPPTVPRPLRFHVPFYQLPQHYIPVKWSLYRPLLRACPSQLHSYQVRTRWRTARRRNSTSPRLTMQYLLEEERWLHDYAQLHPADSATHDKEADKDALARVKALELHIRKTQSEEILEEAHDSLLKTATSLQPIVTPGLIYPSLNNPPLPRLKPQPLHITMPIVKRQEARDKRIIQKQAWREMLFHTRQEDILEQNLGVLSDGAGGETIIAALRSIEDSNQRDSARMKMKFTTTLLEQSARLKHNRPAAITFHNRQMDTARKLKNLMKETALEWTGMRQNMQTL
ncbi:MAG: hypothetical protein CYPHOPRED_003947 [Cyphobasidiales sp. Tagirdzhanova-0007]|nr:MAG: hypothetical protein CYPHOPRED_003947 [Cyphobasidiales sp. Tagirdzhanova-0007]